MATIGGDAPIGMSQEEFEALQRVQEHLRAAAAGEADEQASGESDHTEQLEDEEKEEEAAGGSPTLATPRGGSPIAMVADVEQTLSEAEPSVPRSRFSADTMDQARAERLAFLRSKYRDLRNIERAVQPSAGQPSAQEPEAESQDGAVENGAAAAGTSADRATEAPSKAGSGAAAEPQACGEVEVFEHERWSPIWHGWSAEHLMSTDPTRFTYRSQLESLGAMSDAKPPPHLAWLPGEAWRLDRSPAPRGGTDGDGWAYGFTFKEFEARLASGSTDPSPKRACVRARRWVRRCTPNPEASDWSAPALALKVADAPPHACEPGKRRFEMPLSAIAWSGYLGVRDGSMAGWEQAYFVLLVPGAASLQEQQQGVRDDFR